MNTFHIVPDDFPLIKDGIIGLPMLSNYSYQIVNELIQLNGNEIFFQELRTILPGQTKVETIYLDKGPTRVCFCNTGEQPTVISNDLSDENGLDKIVKMK
jgi:hypothetical protein